MNKIQEFKKEAALHGMAGKHALVQIIDDNYVERIFYYKPAGDTTVYDYRWGDLPKEGYPNMSATLWEATVIQNICWMYGLAPRVHDVYQKKIGRGYYWVQLIDKLHNFDDNFQSVYNEVKKLGKEFGFANEKDDCSRYDVMDGQLVDFNTFHYCVCIEFEFSF